MGTAELTPKEIVRELNKYIVGQAEAKKIRSDCVAQSVASETLAGGHAR